MSIVLRRLAALLGCLVLAAVVAPVAHAGWGPVQPVSTEGANAVDADVAMNATGTTVVGWYNATDKSTEIVRRTSSGSPFSAPLLVSVPGELGGEPAIGVDAAGNAVVAFTGGQFGGPPEENGVKAAIVAGDGTLQWRGTVGPSYTGSVNSVDAGMDAAGNAIVFWRPVNEEGLRYAVRPAGGSFGPLQSIANPLAERLSRPSYAVAGDGAAVAAWESDGRVWASIGSSTGGFAPAQEIGPDEPAPGIAPRVAMAPDGAAVAAWVWRGEDSGNGFVQAAYRPAGGEFGPPQTLAEVFYTGTYDVEVAMSLAGEAAVGWAGGTYDPDRPWPQTVVRRPAGAGAFGEPLSGPDVYAEDPPRLAYDAVGNLYTASRHYYDNAQLLGNAWSGVLAAGASSFGSPAQLSEPGMNVWEPALAAGPAGEATVVWPRGTFPDRFRIEAVTHGSVDAPPPGASAPGPSGAGARSTQPPFSAGADTADRPRPFAVTATARRALRKALARLPSHAGRSLFDRMRRRGVTVPVVFPVAGVVDIRGFAATRHGVRRLVARGRLSRGKAGRGALTVRATRIGRRLATGPGRGAHVRWRAMFRPRAASSRETVRLVEN